jgi:hypothetical protein
MVLFFSWAFGGCNELNAGWPLEIWCDMLKYCMYRVVWVLGSDYLYTLFPFVVAAL